MSPIKVIDVNENEEAKQEEAPIQNEEEAPIKNEEPPTNETILNIDDEIPNQIEEVKQPEELKNNSKTEKLKDKMITCPKCSKTMQLRNYRYKHEKTCSGAIENKPIKPKAKAKPKAVPQPVQLSQSESSWGRSPHQEVIPQPKPKPNPNVVDFKHTNPLQDLTNHYQLLQNEYIKQKQEKYNSLCQNMFSTKPKKR